MRKVIYLTLGLFLVFALTASAEKKKTKEKKGFQFTDLKR